MVDQQNINSQQRILVDILGLYEVTAYERFCPSAAALPELSRLIYRHLLSNDMQLTELLLPEYLTYYDTAILWLRIIQLKQHNGDFMAPQERFILGDTQGFFFIVLEPMLLFIQGLGNIVTRGGHHLFPAFPPFPLEKVNGQSGYWGPIDDETHVVYEEIPCLGVMAEAVRNAISNQSVGYYTSSLAPMNYEANENLLGYYPLTNRNANAKNVAVQCGITPDNFRSTIANTALNIPFLKRISGILSGTQSFAKYRTCVQDLSVMGSNVQEIVTMPMMSDCTRCIQQLTKATSMMLCAPDMYFNSLVYSYQLLKEPGPNGHHTTWYLLSPKPTDATSDTERVPPVPIVRINNRNVLRKNVIIYPDETLPLRFGTTALLAQECRVKIVEFLNVNFRRLNRNARRLIYQPGYILNQIL